MDANNDNYRLLKASPSVNAGDPNSTTATVSAMDLMGGPRVVGGRIDMGAYEFAPVADLRVALVVSNRTPLPNQPVTYSLKITNDGPEPATNVTWQNRLPDNLLFAGGSGVSATNGIVSGGVNSLDAGASTTFTYQLQPTQAARYINAAQITGSDIPDPDSQPNSGTGDGQDDAASVDLRAGAVSSPAFESANPNQVPLPPVQSNQPAPDPAKADLSLAMAVSNRSPRSGDVVTIFLTATNAGGPTATGVSATISLPNGVSFVGGNNISASGSVLTGAFGSVAAGASATLTAQVRISNGGPATLRAEVSGSDQPDPDSQPNSGFTDGQDDTATLDLRTLQ